MSMRGLEAYNSGSSIGRLFNKSSEGEAIFLPGELQSHVESIGAGAASIMVLSSLLSLWTVPAAELAKPDADRGMYSSMYFPRIKNAIAIGAGIVAGKLVYDTGMENTGSAILGATAGLALAELIASFIPGRDADPTTPTYDAGGAPYVTTQFQGVRAN
jgi:hypothetical protein